MFLVIRFMKTNTWQSLQSARLRVRAPHRHIVRVSASSKAGVKIDNQTLLYVQAQIKLYWLGEGLNPGFGYDIDLHKNWDHVTLAQKVHFVEVIWVGNKDIDKVLFFGLSHYN